MDTIQVPQTHSSWSTTQIIRIQDDSFTPFNHGGQTAFITAAMTSTPAPLPTRKLIIPGLVEQDGALSGVTIAFHTLLAECWDLDGGHGNWAEIIYSGWKAWQGPLLWGFRGMSKVALWQNLLQRAEGGGWKASSGWRRTSAEMKTRAN